MSLLGDSQDAVIQNGILAKASYSDICKWQIKHVKLIGGKIIPINVDPNCGSITSNEGTGKMPVRLKLTASLIFFLYVVKFGAFAVEYYTDSTKKGVVLSKVGAYMITAGTVLKTNRYLLKWKGQELSSFLNCFNSFHKIGVGDLNTKMIKMLALNAPVVAIGSSIMGTLILIQDIDLPANLFWKLLEEKGIHVGSTLKLISYIGLWLLGIFEIWETFVMYGMGCILGYFTVFISFWAMCIGTETILNVCKSGGRHSLERSLVLYRRLQIFCTLTNDCVAKDYAISLMTLLITWIILATPLVATPRIRESMQLKEFLMIFGLLVELYMLCFVGYSFPGRANEQSKNIKKMWKKMLESGRGTKNYNQKVVRSFQDIKIRFGSVNYFERTTSLIIVKLEVEQSASFMLVIK